jgi:YfiR/HmsC-like
MEILRQRPVSRPRSLSRLAFAAALFLAGGASVRLPAATATAVATNVSEYQVKAVYLLKFARYVEWPAAAFPSPDTPFLIGVLGANPFESWLESVAAGIKINDRPVEVRYVKTVEEAARCHLVFIARRQDRTEADWLRALQNAPVLTVVESERGLERGAVLAFTLEDSAQGGTRVTFAASLPSAQQAGVQLSASMLASAKKIVRAPVGTKAAP